MYLTTRQAAEVLGVTVNTAHVLLQPADSKEQSTIGRQSNLYLSSRVHNLHEKRKKRNGKGQTSKDIFYKMKRCDECGTYFRHATETKCIICLTGCDPTDPGRVKIKPKKQQRVCPICGEALWEGEYVCPRCKNNKKKEGLDLDLAYGSINITKRQ